MNTLKIINISNSSNKVQITLSDTVSYVVSDRVFIYGGSLDNTTLDSRNPFSDNNNGYKVLTINNNVITIDKQWSSGYVDSIDGYISNICINNSEIYILNSDIVSIKESLIINSSTIGQPTTNLTNIDSINIQINIWNAYINNSNINIGNIGNWFSNNTEPNVSNSVIVKNSNIGIDNTSITVYFIDSETIDCTFGKVCFNGGLHRSELSQVVVDQCIINNGSFYDMIFEDVIMNDGTIGGLGVPLSFIDFDNPTTPTKINMTQTSGGSDERITLSTKNILYNFGNTVFSLFDATQHLIANEFTGVPLTIDTVDVVLVADYDSVWSLPNDPTILGNAFISISNIKKGIINGGNINYTAIGNDTDYIKIDDTTLSSCYVSNGLLSNINLNTDINNLSLILKNCYYNDSINYSLIYDSTIKGTIGFSDIKRSIINGNMSTNRTKDSFLIAGGYVNTYSENLAIKNISYVSGVVPDIITVGLNTVPPNYTSVSTTTVASVTISTFPDIIVQLTELIDSGSNYIIPNLGDFLKITLTKTSNTYTFYVYVTQQIIDDITDLNDAHLHSSARPVKTLITKGMNTNTATLNGSGITLDVSIFADFVSVLPTNLSFTLGFKSLFDGNFYYSSTIASNLNPFVPSIRITVDPPYPTSNVLLGDEIYIEVIDILQSSISIFNVTNPPPPGPGQYIPDQLSAYYILTGTTLDIELKDSSGSYTSLNFSPGSNLDLSATIDYKLISSGSYTSGSATASILIA